MNGVSGASFGEALGPVVVGVAAGLGMGAIAKLAIGSRGAVKVAAVRVAMLKFRT